MVDDASPDGTQEVAKQLAGVYGKDKVVSLLPKHHQNISLNDIGQQVLKPRAGKLGLG